MAQQSINFRATKALTPLLPQPLLPKPSLKRGSEESAVKVDSQIENKRIKISPCATDLINSNFTPSSNQIGHAVPQQTLPAPAPVPYRGLIPVQHPAAPAFLKRTLLSPISKRDLKVGTLYLFTRDSDPGYVKIGTTHNKIYVRKSHIKGQCRFEPNVQFVIENVPYAGRIETLIHRELEILGFRRFEPVCRFGGSQALPNITVKAKEEDKEEGDDIVEDKNTLTASAAAAAEEHVSCANTLEDMASPTVTPTATNNDIAISSPRLKTCHGNHQEWFEIPLDGPLSARSIMEKWVSFMRTAQPYNDLGVFKPIWSMRVFHMLQPHNIPTSDVLWAWWCEMMNPTAAANGLAQRQSVWFVKMAAKRSEGREVMRILREHVERQRQYHHHHYHSQLQQQNQQQQFGMKDGDWGKAVANQPRSGFEVNKAESGSANENGCIRDWFSDMVGERVSLGCANPDHGDKMCAYEMINLFDPQPWLAK